MTCSGRSRSDQLFLFIAATTKFFFFFSKKAIVSNSANKVVFYSQRNTMLLLTSILYKIFDRVLKVTLSVYSSHSLTLFIAHCSLLFLLLGFLPFADHISFLVIAEKISTLAKKRTWCFIQGGETRPKVNQWQNIDNSNNSRIFSAQGQGNVDCVFVNHISRLSPFMPPSYRKDRWKIGIERPVSRCIAQSCSNRVQKVFATM